MTGSVNGFICPETQQQLIGSTLLTIGNITDFSLFSLFQCLAQLSHKNGVIGNFWPRCSISLSNSNYLTPLTNSLVAADFSGEKSAGSHFYE